MNSIEKITVPIEIRALKTANIYHISGDYNYIVDTGMSENGYSQIKNAIDLSKIDMVYISSFQCSDLYRYCNFFNRIHYG